MRSIHENARVVARNLAATLEFEQSRRERKKVEMLFAHLKRILKVDRLRLRGLTGAQDEFLLAATAQNLRCMAKRLMPFGEDMFSHRIKVSRRGTRRSTTAPVASRTHAANTSFARCDSARSKLVQGHCSRGPVASCMTLYGWAEGRWTSSGTALCGTFCISPARHAGLLCQAVSLVCAGRCGQCGKA